MNIPFLQSITKTVNERTASHSPSKLSAFFLGWLVVFCGGLSALFRMGADSYSPLTVNGFYLTTMAVVWVCALALFGIVVLRLRELKTLTTEEAAAFVVSVVALVGVALFILYESTVIPRNHGQDERTKLASMVVAFRRDLPKNINDDITETGVNYATGMLSFQYSIKNVVEHGWNVDVLRPSLMTQACDYFKTYSKYSSLGFVQFAFIANDKPLILNVTKKDCVPVPAAAQN